MIYTVFDAKAISVSAADGQVLLVFNGLAEQAGFVDGSEIALRLSASDTDGLLRALSDRLAVALAQAEPQPNANVTFLPSSPPSSSSH